MSDGSATRPGPIRAAAGEGRHFLTRPLDRRLEVSSWEEAERPDIVLVSVGRYEELERIRNTPQPLVQRVRDGEAVLVIDHSCEGGAFAPKFAGVLHSLLREIDAPPARTVFLTQNRQWEQIYRAFCLGARLEPVGVLIYDRYIRDFFAEHETGGEAAFEARLAAFQARAAVREKRFVCLNFSPRPTKVLLLLKLIEGGLFDQGFISFPGFDKQLNVRAAKKSDTVFGLLTLPGLEDVGADLSVFVDDLHARGGAVLGPVRTGSKAGHYKDVSGDMALDEYNRAWFTVITETEMHSDRRVTEKPFKALANFSPLLVLGNTGALSLIRGFGFRSFEGAFDEAYDAELDPRRRFFMVYDEIARLCGLSDAQWRDLEAALSETLVFNARHALTRMPAIYRDDLEPGLVDQLLAIRDGRAALA